MPTGSIQRSLRVLLAMALAAHMVLAQKYTPPPPPLTPGPCVPTKKEPCPPPPAPAAATPSTAEQFPFPGDAPAGDKPAPAGTDPAQPAAKSFPFPGEPGEAPVAAPTAPTPAAPTPAARSFPFPDDAYSSSSSSSSSSDSPVVPDEPTPAAKAAPAPDRSQRRHLPKVEDLDRREAEDLEVSHYYVTTGNFLGAYMRAQDAVKTIPDDPMAHFALALTAQKLKKNEEAIAEYKVYLKLDADGEKVKEAQHALTELLQK